MKTKKTLKKYFFFLAISLILCVISLYIYKNDSNYSSEARNFEKIKQSKYLNVITTYNNVSNGGAEEIRKKTKKLSDSLKIEVRISFEDNYQKALNKLKTGQADMLAFYTPKISNIDTTQLIFIENKIIDPIYLVQSLDSTKMIKTQNELANKTITLPLGSEYKIFVDHLSDYIGETINISYDSLYNYEQLIMKVSFGKIDYTLCPNELKCQLSGKIDNVNMDLPISYDIMGGWIIRRNCSELKKIL